MKDSSMTVQVFTAADTARSNNRKSTDAAGGDAFQATFNEQMTQREQAKQNEHSRSETQRVSDSKQAEVDGAKPGSEQVEDSSPDEVDLQNQDLRDEQLLPSVVTAVIAPQELESTGERSAATSEQPNTSSSSEKIAANQATVGLGVDISAPLENGVVETLPANASSQQASVAGALGILAQGKASPAATAGQGRATSLSALTGSAGAQRANHGADAASNARTALAAQVSDHEANIAAQKLDVFADSIAKQTRSNAFASTASASTELLEGSQFSSALNAASGAVGARSDTSPASIAPRALPALDTPMDSQQWAHGLGRRIAWGLGNGIGAATLEVNPRELGPVSIQLTVSDDEASIHFASQHASVRDAIEAAMPRLREALANEGIRLADVAVGTGDSGPRDDPSQRGNAARTSGVEGDDSPSDSDNALPRVANLSALVDTFA